MNEPAFMDEHLYELQGKIQYLESSYLSYASSSMKLLKDYRESLQTTLKSSSVSERTCRKLLVLQEKLEKDLKFLDLAVPSAFPCSLKSGFQLVYSELLGLVRPDPVSRKNMTSLLKLLYSSVISYCKQLGVGAHTSSKLARSAQTESFHNKQLGMNQKRDRYKAWKKEEVHSKQSGLRQMIEKFTKMQSSRAEAFPNSSDLASVSTLREARTPEKIPCRLKGKPPLNYFSVYPLEKYHEKVLGLENEIDGLKRENSVFKNEYGTWGEELILQTDRKHSKASRRLNNKVQLDPERDSNPFKMPKRDKEELGSMKKAMILELTYSEGLFIPSSEVLRDSLTEKENLIESAQERMKVYRKSIAKLKEDLKDKDKKIEEVCGQYYNTVRSLHEDIEIIRKLRNEVEEKKKEIHNLIIERKQFTLLSREKCDYVIGAEMVEILPTPETTRNLIEKQELIRKILMDLHTSSQQQTKETLQTLFAALLATCESLTVSVNEELVHLELKLHNLSSHYAASYLKLYDAFQSLQSESYTIHTKAQHYIETTSSLHEELQKSRIREESLQEDIETLIKKLENSQSSVLDELQMQMEIMQKSWNNQEILLTKAIDSKTSQIHSLFQENMKLTRDLSVFQLPTKEKHLKQELSSLKEETLKLTTQLEECKNNNQTLNSELNSLKNPEILIEHKEYEHQIAALKQNKEKWKHQYRLFLDQVQRGMNAHNPLREIAETLAVSQSNLFGSLKTPSFDWSFESSDSGYLDVSRKNNSLQQVRNKEEVLSPQRELVQGTRKQKNNLRETMSETSKRVEGFQM